MRRILAALLVGVSALHCGSVATADDANSKLKDISSTYKDISTDLNTVADRTDGKADELQAKLWGKRVDSADKDTLRDPRPYRNAAGELRQGSGLFDKARKLIDKARDVLSLSIVKDAKREFDRGQLTDADDLQRFLANRSEAKNKERLIAIGRVGEPDVQYTKVGDTERVVGKSGITYYEGKADNYQKMGLAELTNRTVFSETIGDGVTSVANKMAGTEKAIDRAAAGDTDGALDAVKTTFPSTKNVVNAAKDYNKGDLPGAYKNLAKAAGGEPAGIVAEYSMKGTNYVNDLNHRLSKDILDYRYGPSSGDKSPDPGTITSRDTANLNPSNASPKSPDGAGNPSSSSPGNTPGSSAPGQPSSSSPGNTPGGSTPGQPASSGAQPGSSGNPSSSPGNAPGGSTPGQPASPGGQPRDSTTAPSGGAAVNQQVASAASQPDGVDIPSGTRAGQSPSGAADKMSGTPSRSTDQPYPSPAEQELRRQDLNKQYPDDPAFKKPIGSRDSFSWDDIQARQKLHEAQDKALGDYQEKGKIGPQDPNLKDLRPSDDIRKLIDGEPAKGDAKLQIGDTKAGAKSLSDQAMALAKEGQALADALNRGQKDGLLGRLQDLKIRADNLRAQIPSGGATSASDPKVAALMAAAQKMMALGQEAMRDPSSAKRNLAEANNLVKQAQQLAQPETSSLGPAPKGAVICMGSMCTDGSTPKGGGSDVSGTRKADDLPDPGATQKISKPEFLGGPAAIRNSSGSSSMPGFTGAPAASPATAPSDPKTTALMADAKRMMELGQAALNDPSSFKKNLDEANRLASSAKQKAQPETSSLGSVKGAVICMGSMCTDGSTPKGGGSDISGTGKDGNLPDPGATQKISKLGGASASTKSSGASSVPTTSNSGAMARVNLPGGYSGTATPNPDGTVTISNNFATVTLSKSQFSKVASGDLGPVSALMGSASGNSGKLTGYGSSSSSASRSGSSDISGSSSGIGTSRLASASGGSNIKIDPALLRLKPAASSGLQVSSLGGPVSGNSVRIDPGTPNRPNPVANQPASPSVITSPAATLAPAPPPGSISISNRPALSGTTTAPPATASPPSAANPNPVPVANQPASSASLGGGKISPPPGGTASPLPPGVGPIARTPGGSQLPEQPINRPAPQPGGNSGSPIAPGTPGTVSPLPSPSLPPTGNLRPLPTTPPGPQIQPYHPNGRGVIAPAAPSVAAGAASGAPPRAAGNAASGAAGQAASNAAGGAASSAASGAANRAASSAASRAASTVASTSASNAAGRAASGAAGRAASNAASSAAARAASNVASHAAGNAASNAASNAAGRAASNAASNAAGRAASNAASRAASNVAANAAANAASRIRIPSDIRLKRDIIELGQLSNGLHVYRYRYIGDRETYVGVMAQQVRQVDPGAIGRGADGYLSVDYGRLGLRFMTWDQWTGNMGQKAKLSH